VANESNAAHFDSLARQALSCYGGESWQCSFLRHNENLTFKVLDDAGHSYLLRLHKPAVKGFEGLAQSQAAIRSELMWLEALRRDTGMALQQPVENTAGDCVTLLNCSNAEKPIPVTLMTWVDGEPVNWQEENAVELAAGFARVVSVFHRQSQVFQPPSGFIRPAYDKNSLMAALAELNRGVQAGIITAADYRQFELACEYILRLMDNIGTGREVWGLIHSDWVGNLIRNGKAVTPIDFSLCGFGPYALDLAICLCNLNRPLRPVFLEHFGRDVSDGELRQIESFTIYIITLSASRFIFTNLWGDWFTRRFPVIAQQQCTALLANRSFLFDM